MHHSNPPIIWHPSEMKNLWQLMHPKESSGRPSLPKNSSASAVKDSGSRKCCTNWQGKSRLVKARLLGILQYLTATKSIWWTVPKARNWMLLLCPLSQSKSKWYTNTSLLLKGILCKITIIMGSRRRNTSTICLAWSTNHSINAESLAFLDVPVVPVTKSSLRVIVHSVSPGTDSKPK